MADYATLLRDHITLTCRSIDRLFLQAYVPKLQSVGQVCLFLNGHRGFKIPSSAAFGQIGEAYVAAIHRWAQAEGIPIRYFAKGDNKEVIAEPLLRAAASEGGDGKVVLIGIAQEKASAWRSWKRKGQEKAAHPHMEWGRQMVFVNHFYFYLWDPEWGSAFWKTNAYAPYPIWLWLNGHSWAQRQFLRNDHIRRKHRLPIGMRRRLYARAGRKERVDGKRRAHLQRERRLFFGSGARRRPCRQSLRKYRRRRYGRVLPGPHDQGCSGGMPKRMRDALRAETRRARPLVVCRTSLFHARQRWRTLRQPGV